MSIDYKNWFENAKNELQKVQEEKAGLQCAAVHCDRQIAALIQTMNAIAPLVGEEPLTLPASEETEMAPGGMTDSIRNILTEAGEPLTAAEIRDLFRAEGIRYEILLESSGEYTHDPAALDGVEGGRDHP